MLISSASPPQTGATSSLKNRVFITLVVITNTFGTVLLGRGMTQMPDFAPAHALAYIARFLLNPWIVCGIALLVLWMIFQLSMLTWADLSYVLPVTASYYILTAIISRFFVHERISLTRWTGIAVISLGVMLVSHTPPRTHPAPPEGFE